MQLYVSSSLTEIDSLLSSISHCNSDIWNWMSEDKLKLNSDKIEALFTDVRQLLSTISSSSLWLSCTMIHLLFSVKSLDVILDSTLSIQPISSLVKTFFPSLHCSHRRCQAIFSHAWIMQLLLRWSPCGHTPHPSTFLICCCLSGCSRCVRLITSTHLPLPQSLLSSHPTPHWPHHLQTGLSSLQMSSSLCFRLPFCFPHPTDSHHSPHTWFSSW